MLPYAISPPRSRSTGLPVALSVLTLMALGIAAIRSLTFAEAFERDLMVYMTVADGILHGRPLYAEMWDHKPPGVHWTYAAFAALFGPSPLAIFIMGMVTALVTLFGCYSAAKAIAGRSAGLAAAGVWVIASNDLLLQSNQPNVEVFINACLVWAFALLLPSISKPVRVGRFIAIGLLLFLSTLYKQVSVAVAGPLLAIYVVLAGYEFFSFKTGANWSRFPWLPLFRAFLAGSVIFIGWSAVVAFFVVQGHFSDFFDAVIIYNQEYAGSVMKNLLTGVMPGDRRGVVFYVPLVVLVGLWLLRVTWTTRSTSYGLLLAYCVGAYIAISLPGHRHPHYYQLGMPALAIAAGCLVAYVMQSPVRPLKRGIVLLSIALPLTSQAIIYWMVPLDDIPVAKYGHHGQQSLETKRMASWISERLPSGGRLFHWGAEPGVYFWSGQQSPTGFVYNYPLLASQLSPVYTAKLLEQLRQSPPDLVVAAKEGVSINSHPVRVWLDQNYVKIDGPSDVDLYEFLKRR